MVNKTHTTLSDLKPGEEAVVDSFCNEDVSLKLMEMGLVPGERISVERIAPFGDPIAVWVSGYLLSMRKESAASVIVVDRKKKAQL